MCLQDYKLLSLHIPTSGALQATSLNYRLPLRSTWWKTLFESLQRAECVWLVKKLFLDSNIILAFEALCVCNQVYALQESSLVKVDILLNDKPVSELAFVAHAERAKDKAKQVTSSLKENLPRQQFAIKIQVTLKWKIQITLSRTILVTSLSLNYLQLTFFLITPMFKIERF